MDLPTLYQKLARVQKKELFRANMISINGYNTLWESGNDRWEQIEHLRNFIDQMVKDTLN